VKRTIYLLAVALMALISCKNSKQFTIDGKVENAGNIKKVLLYETDQLIDSAFLNEKNEFKFTRSTPGPNFYSLAIEGKTFLVVAQNGDELEFSTDYADTTNTYSIEGSKESEKIRQFNILSTKYGKVYQQIQDQYSSFLSAHPGDQKAKDSIYNALMPLFQKNMDAFSQETLKFAEENKDNLAGFYAIGTLDQMKYETEMIRYAEDIKSKYPDNEAVQSFVKKMLEIKPVSVGQKAPDFELPTPDGKMVRLSDHKGKYVLLDFWASWCAPCRAENPNIVKRYNEYKNKGFDILSVSLDDDKQAWMQAIKTDNLAWTHVSELKKWDGKVTNTYKVDGIPASFLLDPEGKIVAKNLRGEELSAFLSKTLK
jgi:peroxiredoxin